MKDGSNLMDVTENET